MSQAVQGAVTGRDKLNIGALGNIVPQLHVHVIARFKAMRLGRSPSGASVPPAPYGAAEAR